MRSNTCTAAKVPARLSCAWGENNMKRLWVGLLLALLLGPTAAKGSTVITAENAAELRMTGILGSGELFRFIWSPGADRLAFVNSLGTWITGISSGETHRLPDIVGTSVGLEYSPDGGQLVVSECLQTDEAGCQQSRITILDSRTLERLYADEVAGSVNDLRFSPDGLNLIFVSYREQTKEFHRLVSIGRSYASQSYPPVWDRYQSPALVWSASQELWYLVYFNDGFQVIDAATGRLIASDSLANWFGEKAASLRVQTLGFSPAGDELAFKTCEQQPDLSCGDTSVWLWDLQSGGFSLVMQGLPGSIISATFTADGRYLAALVCRTFTFGTCTDAQLSIFDPSSRSLQAVEVSMPAISRIQLSKQSDRFILYGTQAGAVFMQTISVRGEVISELSTPLNLVEGHSSSVQALGFAADGQTLISAGDTSLRQWNINAQREDWVASFDSTIQTSAVGNRFGRVAISFAIEPDVHVWDVVRQQEQLVWEASDYLVYKMAYSADESWLATTRSDGVMVWDSSDGSEYQRLVLTGALEVAWSSDRRYLVGGSYQGAVRIWDLQNPSSAAIELQAGTAGVGGLAFARQDSLLVVGGFDNQVYVWDWRSGELKATLGGHTFGVFKSGITALASSPDGELVASSAHDDTVRLWDMRTLEGVATLENRSFAARCVQFSPDGTTLAVCGEDGTIRLWSIP